MADFKNFTLSDFYNMDQVRSSKYVEVIVDNYKGKPVRLMGYRGSPDLSHVEIAEDAHVYYQHLLKELNK